MQLMQHSLAQHLHATLQCKRPAARCSLLCPNTGGMDHMEQPRGGGGGLGGAVAVSERLSCNSPTLLHLVKYVDGLRACWHPSCVQEGTGENSQAARHSNVAALAASASKHLLQFASVQRSIRHAALPGIAALQHATRRAMRAHVNAAGRGRGAEG